MADVGANRYLNADGTVGTYHDSSDSDLIDDTINGVQGVLGNKSWTQPTLPNNTRAGSYDTDGDGMADVWEVATFGDLSRDGTGDFDSDGYTDVEEFLNLVDGSSPAPPSTPSNGKIIKSSTLRINGGNTVIKSN